MEVPDAVPANEVAPIRRGGSGALQVMSVVFAGLFVVAVFAVPMVRSAPASAVTLSVGLTSLIFWAVFFVASLAHKMMLPLAIISVAMCGGLFFIGPLTFMGGLAFGAAAIVSSAALLLAAIRGLPRRRWREVTTAVGVSCTVLAAAAFVGLPDSTARSDTVAALGALAALSALYLLASVARAIIAHQFQTSLAISAAAVVLLECAAAVGLNAYADSAISAAVTPIQDTYTQIAAATAQGDGVAQGYAPAGASFAVVSQEMAQSVRQLTRFKVPSALAGYKAAVSSWGSQVETAATTAAKGGPWRTTYWPPLVHMHLSNAEQQSSLATANRHVANELQFGNYALAHRDRSAVLYVGASLAALEYWISALSGVRAGLVTSQLQFIEPIDYQLGAANGPTLPPDSCRLTVACDGGPVSSNSRLLADLRAAATASGSGCPDHDINGLALAGGNRGANGGTCYYWAQQWNSAEGQILPLLGTDVFPPGPANVLRDCGSYVLNGLSAETGGACTKALTPVTLQNFERRCPALQPLNSPSPAWSYIGTTEGGWECARSSTCWTYLSNTGVQYQGGPAGCFQQNLFPPGDGFMGLTWWNITDSFKTVVPPPPRIPIVTPSSATTASPTGGTTPATTASPPVGSIPPTSPSPANWDGTYTIEWIRVDPDAPTAFTIADYQGHGQLVVHNGEIAGWVYGGGTLGFPGQSPYGGPIPIQADGNASLTVAPYGVQVATNFHFSTSSSGAIQVQGTMDALTGQAWTANFQGIGQ